MPIPSPGSPFSEKYEILSELGHGSSGTTYRAKERASGRPLVLKHIPIPESEAQVQALIFSGAAADEAGVQEYYSRSAAELRAELSYGAAFAGSPYFLPFRDFQFDGRENAVGFDVYLVADFQQTLPTFLSTHEVTVLDALNLGLDICDALTALHEAGLMHSNIKLENIYRTSTGKFLLGDLGLVKIEELPYSSLPDSRFGSYTAPEYADIMSPLNLTSEMYSLGMILYRIFNGDHAPFVDEETTIQAAETMRMEGKELPAPMYADYELSAIILKACAFQPEDRYEAPEALRQELALYMQRNAISNSPIAPPIISDPDEIVTEDAEQEAAAPISFTNVEELDEKFIEHFSPVAPESPAEPAPEEPAELPPVQEEPQDAAEPPESPEQPESEEEPEKRISVAEEFELGDLLNENRPQSAEPSPDAPEPEEEPKKKRSKAWILIVLVVLCAAAVAAWLYIRSNSIEVRAIRSDAKTSESITVTIDCDPGEAQLEVVCSDAYGNTFTLPYDGTEYTFDGLSPATTYSIELRAKDRTKLTGATSLLVTTESMTTVVSFSSANVTGTSAELAFIVTGPEPDSWTVEYSSDNGDSGSFVCTSHNLSLQDLTPNTTYTFTLVPPDELTVEGELTCTLTTTASAELTKFEATSVTMDSVELVWEYEGATDLWTVSYTGSDGSEGSLETADCNAAFTGLSAGVTYTFALDCSGLQPTSLSPCTVTTPTGYVETFTAEAVDSTTVSLTWDYSGETNGEDWMVIYTLGTTEPIRSVATTSEPSLTLTGLIPNATYTFELATASGVKLQGDAETELTLPSGGTFSDLGLTNVFIGLFLEPDSSNWTYRNLSVSRTEFLPSESIAFAIEAISTIQSSEEEIQVLYVVRNADGEPVDYYASTYTWDEMWSNSLHVGALQRTPQAVGDYTLEFYFNGQLVRSKEFSVVDALS